MDNRPKNFEARERIRKHLDELQKDPLDVITQAFHAGFIATNNCLEQANDRITRLEFASSLAMKKLEIRILRIEERLPNQNPD